MLCLECKNCKIRLYTSFEPELEKIWKDFYQKYGGRYNSSFEWCYIWFKYFGEGKKLNIITITANNSLHVIAPFYIKKNTLYLIGSVPELYDEFYILHNETSYLETLINYIIENNFLIDFKNINSNALFSKILFRKLEQTKDYSMIIYNFGPKLSTTPEVNFRSNIRSDVSRRKTKLKKAIGEESKIDYDLEKKAEFIDEMIKFHKIRWNGGQFCTIANYEKFLKELYFDSDMTVLCRMYLPSTNTTLAYQFAYIDSTGKVLTYINVFQKDFADYSPSKVLSYEFLKEFLRRGYNNIDMGRGSEDYKYAFSNEYTTLYNLKTKYSWKRHKKLFSFLKTTRDFIKKKIYLRDSEKNPVGS